MRASRTSRPFVSAGPRGLSQRVSVVESLLRALVLAVQEAAAGLIVQEPEGESVVAGLFRVERRVIFIEPPPDRRPRLLGKAVSMTLPVLRTSSAEGRAASTRRSVRAWVAAYSGQLEDSRNEAIRLAGGFHLPAEHTARVLVQHRGVVPKRREGHADHVAETEHQAGDAARFCLSCFSHFTKPANSAMSASVSLPVSM